MTTFVHHYWFLTETRSEPYLEGVSLIRILGVRGASWNRIEGVVLHERYLSLSRSVYLDLRSESSNFPIKNFIYIISKWRNIVLQFRVPYLAYIHRLCLDHDLYDDHDYDPCHHGYGLCRHGCDADHDLDPVLLAENFLNDLYFFWLWTRKLRVPDPCVNARLTFPSPLETIPCHGTVFPDAVRGSVYFLFFSPRDAEDWFLCLRRLRPHRYTILISISVRFSPFLVVFVLKCER